MCKSLEHGLFLYCAYAYACACACAFMCVVYAVVPIENYNSRWALRKQKKKNAE